MNYPKTPQVDAGDTFFGHRVADPYRWLEKDIRHDADIRHWIDAQNEVTDRHLSALPGRSAFHRRLTELFDHARLTTPEKRGNRYFFTRHRGLENQGALLVRDGVDGSDTVVIDPNTWSEDGTVALAEWAVSHDGTHVAYAVQEGGADWRTIKVLDVDRATTLADTIRWARFTSIAWAPDGTGFFYSRHPEPEKDTEFLALALGHAVYFHKLGTPQAEDRLVHAPEATFPLIHTVDIPSGGSLAAIYSTALQGGNQLAVLDLDDPGWPLRTVVATLDIAWTLIGSIGTKLFLTTQMDADRGRLVTVDLADPKLRMDELVAERADAVIRNATLVGDRIFVVYTIDARTEVMRYRLDGSPDGIVALPGIGSTSAFVGQPGDDEAFFVFTSHDAPARVYRHDVAANTSAVWAAPELPVDPDAIAVEQRFYASKDGTRVPIFIVRRADVTTPAPTLLTAYGGFGISMVPYYSPAAMAWIEMGGVYAVANIRGGGEYGKSWHDGGRLRNKQNSFDDFIAAAEYLKQAGFTAPDGLAIHGESNGGLLIGAVCNQRPDLFAAALPSVGVLDMLRFTQFTGGPLWTQEFGSPDVEADFHVLRSYSPLHNIRQGVSYPAILVSTADTDDRVVPAHSFKYLATLQANDLGKRPHLLRVDTRSGHGTGKPVEKTINELADQWAFAARWTGLDVG